MIRVSQRLLRALEESLDRGWFRYEDLAKTLGGREEALYTLLEGFALGLYNTRGEDTFEIRREGLRLLEAWRMAGKPSVDPWLDSRVYTMLVSAVAAGGVPKEWIPILADRGLVDGEGTPTSVASELLSLVEVLERGLVVTKSMARALVKAPEGPAEAGLYGRFLPVYEAMGLVVGTVPLNPYYSLTLPGRLLRKALAKANLDAPWPSVVNPWILRALEKVEAGEEATPEEKTVLGTLGYLKATGSLDYPGRLVLEAYRALRRAWLRPPMALSAEEEKLVQAVAETWRDKEEKRPNIIVDKEWISRKYRELYGEEIPREELGLDLLHLESMGLVEEAEEEGKQIYKLTRYGEEIQDLPGLGQGSPVPAVKAITYPYALLSPSIEWVEAGINHGTVAVGGPTKKGVMLARLSRARRRPMVTRPEAAVIRRLPEEKSLERYLLEEAAKAEGGDPEEALSRLEARGLIETLPDGRVRLTRAGRLVKIALLGVPAGIATPIHPIIIRVLEAMEKIGKEDIAKIVNETGLTLGSVKDALVLARQAKYIGRGGGLTAAGRALLDAARLLAGEEEATL